MASHTTFALFQIGTQSFCVADAYVVQAVPHPTDLIHLPRTTGALQGVFMHRGQLVPLVNLAHWMGQAATQKTGAGETLVLQAEGMVVAIEVDAVKGLLQTQADALRQVCHDASAIEFFHTVLVREGGLPPLAVLDPQRLVAQTHIWCDADTATAQVHDALQDALQGATQQTDHATLADAAQTLAVFRMGTTHIAIAADAVGEVSQGLPLQRMNGLGGDFLGMTSWRGHDVPVVNLCHMLDLPAPDATQSGWLVLLHQHHHSMGFYVQELVSVGPVAAANLQTEVDLSSALKTVAEGSFIRGDASRVYVLSARALLESSPLSRAIARRTAKNMQASAAQGEVPLQEDRIGSSNALIVFKSMQAWATPMASMLEIIRPDASQRQALQAGERLPGAMEWRNQAIPLRDMRQTLGYEATEDSADARIIVLQSDAGPRALLVESVHALIPGHLGARSRFTTAQSKVDMVTVGHGHDQKSYQLIDLNGLGDLQGSDALANPNQF